jgi:hypothetical protein
MAFENLKESIADVDSNIKEYVGSNMEYYQLKSFKVLMKSITSLTKILLLGAVILVTILMLSFAASYGIGQALGSTYYGFLVVGLFFLLISFIVYLLRNKLDKPLLRKFSKFYFENHESN